MNWLEKSGMVDQCEKILWMDKRWAICLYNTMLPNPHGAVRIDSFIILYRKNKETVDFCYWDYETKTPSSHVYGSFPSDFIFPEEVLKKADYFSKIQRLL